MTQEEFSFLKTRKLKNGPGVTEAEYSCSLIQVNVMTAISAYGFCFGITGGRLCFNTCNSNI